jgi:hypothetical protein
MRDIGMKNKGDGDADCGVVLKDAKSEEGLGDGGAGGGRGSKRRKRHEEEEIKKKKRKNRFMRFQVFS